MSENMSDSDKSEDAQAKAKEAKDVRDPQDMAKDAESLRSNVKAKDAESRASDFAKLLKGFKRFAQSPGSLEHF